MDDAQLHSEIDALRGRLNIKTPTGKPPSAEHWRGVLKDISPTQFYQRFARIAGDNGRVVIDLDLNNSFGITIKVYPPNVGENLDAVSPQLKFNFVRSKTNSVEFRRADVALDMQDKGIGVPYARESIAFLKELGIERIKINTQEVGGYAWARYGFSPYSEREWESLKRSVGKRYHPEENRISFYKEYIEDEAPLSFKITEGDKQAIDAWLALPFEQLEENFDKVCSLNRVVGTYRGHVMTVGKILLHGHKWDGVLSLNDDSPGYKKFQDYCAGREQSRGMGAG
ncbi:MAG: hypothetical protein J0M34_02250 [Alphaproteobacteria bacterium]|nr:hypothetical protein [Alphaproteobacteria bacterium]